MAKILLVTYNAMNGIPVGRFEKGNMVVYSGDYGRAKYAGIPGIPNEQNREAEAKVAELKHDIATDVQNVDEVYVYVGAAAMEGAMELVRDLQKAGKKVHMIACDCDEFTKRDFANELNLGEVIWSECGGRHTCADLVQQLAS